MLSVGLPKGRLLPRSEAAVAVFREGAGFHDGTSGGGSAGEPLLDARFLRMPDLPGLVAEGLLDAGIAGEEWLVESGADVVRVAPLCWYHVRICALGRPDRAPDADGTEPVRVVSEYARVARHFARARWGEGHTQRTVRGSVEHYLPDLADVAVECVETGESMRRRGLVVLETLFEADVWLICSRAAADEETLTRLRRWAEVIAAPAPDDGPAHRRPALSAQVPSEQPLSDRFAAPALDGRR
ncbi:ATP phosphoribosyltransferase [Streptomyces sp. DSM 110735]|uniref:ATP phosphoribosyltransferase n=1 Tax=Streptomyces sp. DSM 110735 TaxID=2775031 RepID=UPI0018F5890E|nr:ATP phosphoribosyltransferase [Streptomyces sp. DSM 110735]MBJ7902216.1 ATP phosphoribosyltransferase [Streptomyces sp. DSM 110735]